MFYLNQSASFNPIRKQSQDLTLIQTDESIVAFNQRFIFPLPFARKIIKINLWNQGSLPPYKHPY
jgi:hypothetical protein